ncbi:MAG TPA: Fe-S cluster assembly protein NifU [Cyanobacteria bacterium UBA11149]|nr:Fe-S cluster assembly protein NifU [Cyanobacteria bacterium UBA11367]HBE58641.1 Fe-S cluster assembly protein NifU [Cyanobacteria bacterium UBA11366]HBK66692.1 Fe-S cluster assembly protein NifU [Cyanobacteria bacterium UBA11166]HBR73949.1 Fe-S cluster assembly protein NifU [Cyanobacteria bacterium UBA11159]HBS69619.1 Fe-S cluster assembly protein NifU [Cyanobacteria bacterium UBA11153]HBW88508.1 Fe-S cluster assembly protein NifU [Cyanobacteria bacterium UBA11149]HCA96414.1 Fe-S cluster a
MWDYTEKVLDLFYNPKNQGAIEDNNEPGIAVVFGEVGSIACGDALRLHLKIDQEQDTILDSRFQTFGCTSAIASSSALTELVKGLTLDQALKVTNKEIADFLGGLPEAKMHCSVMGQEALEAAIYKYRGIEIEEHAEDDGALICTCFGISEPKIRRVIVENNLTTAEQVTSYVKAGGGCGSCLSGIDDVIAEVLKDKANITKVANEIVFAKDRNQQGSGQTLTTVQKISLIQKVLLEDVRPLLVADGGDVELYDVEGDIVKVFLKGACGSCPSSTSTLKGLIETTLKEKVLSSLVVQDISH